MIQISSTRKRQNLEVDKISITCATIPLNIAIPTTHFAIYIKGGYIHLSLRKIICEVSFVSDAKKIIQYK